MGLSKTEQLFLQASRHNWDEGTAALERILKSPACDLGTALMIYWRARPEFYAEHPELQDDDAFRVACLARKLIEAGRYPGVIAYEPELGADQPAIGRLLEELPALLKQRTPGEISAVDLIEGLRGEGAFLNAAAHGRIEVLQEMLDAGMDVDAVDDGWTALHHACWQGQSEAVRLLLSAGADKDKPASRDGRTAIHFACFVHHGDPATAIEIVDTLLSQGVKVDQKSRIFGTPLHLAALAGQAKVAEFLIGRGAKPNQTRRPRALRETALHVAANAGALEVARCLLANGWNLEATDKKGKRPLHHACDFPGWDHFDEIDRSPVVAYLLAQGANREAKDDSGQTPLQQAEVDSSLLGPKEREAILGLLRGP